MVPHPSVSILLLAAGSSSRLSQPKQLLSYRGKTLLRHAAEVAVASQANQAYVVLGFESKRMEQELNNLPIHVIENRKWGEGIGSSIRVGINSLYPTTNAVLILLCDQPLITTELLNTIITTFHSSGKRIVASEYAGTFGVPVLFARQMFPELITLKDNQGAKQIILKHPSEVAPVPFPGGAFDVDTEADLKKL